MNSVLKKIIYCERSQISKKEASKNFKEQGGAAAAYSVVRKAKPMPQFGVLASELYKFGKFAPVRSIAVAVAMLGAIDPAMAEDNENVLETFGRSINDALTKHFTVEIIFLLILAVLLLIVAAVLFEVFRSSKIKQELQDLAMAKFDFNAEKLNLRLSSAAILKKIAQKSGLEDPSSILKFSYVFESSLEKYYESEKIESISNDILVQISALRKILGFSPLPRGISITSTRQFSSGDECIMQIKEHNHVTSQVMICQIFNSEERYWTVTRPPEISVKPGMWVHMSLTRDGDAEYTFTTQILRCSNEELVLAHTNKINRVQQRNWLRVNVDIPVKATLLDASRMGDILSGKIIDLSGGGLGVMLPARLSSNSMILLNFELPGRGQIADFPVKVVRVAAQSDGNSSKTAHSVTFTGERDSVNEKIIQYVFEKHREDLSAMRANEDSD